MPVWSCALPAPPVPSPRILRVVDRIWAEMLREPRMAGPTLSAGLRAERSLGSKERPVAGDMLTGMIRHERALLRIDPDPIRAWLRIAEEGIPDLPDPPNAYAIATSIPDALADEWWQRLGADRALVLARTLAGRAPVWLRALREPVEIPVAHTREGAAIRLDAKANINTFEAFREGRIEVQDLGSQRIAEAAFLGVGSTVLDLCAGAGGKSLTLAALGAKVTAWDVRPAALRELADRARRANLDIRIGEPTGRYDLVVVDAPCSGTGVLRRHPENRWKLRFPTDLQRSLLARARTLGGSVVYATCSLAQRENEEIAGEGTTLWPEEGGSEGYFWAVG
ncbi:RNA methyltransferase [Deltaproteobacteria bacterium]|nr:RNA methyltransferase [Deltaproteobacteria bacterium]